MIVYKSEIKAADGSGQVVGRFDVDQFGDGYQAWLTVWDANEKVIHRVEVGVSYAARYGPDCQDVDYWQKTAMDAIESQEAR